MKKTLGIAFLTAIVLSGCASTQTNPGSASQAQDPIKNAGVSVADINRTSVERPDQHALAEQGEEKSKEAVVWSHKEIQNLKRLNDFVDNVKQGVKDRVRVVSHAKEGGVITNDLTYEGETIHVATDRSQVKPLSEDADKNRNNLITTDKYDQIVIEDRFNEHYKGTFTEYWLKDESGDRKTLILQIHPNLQEEKGQPVGTKASQSPNS